MMSDPATECVPPHYQTLMSSTSSAVPGLNVPVGSFIQNVSPPPPMYYSSPPTQTWSHPTVAPQWQLSTIIPQNMDPSLPFFQNFLKGKPRTLGNVVIVAAILEICLGIALALNCFCFTLISGIPFWGPVFCIIAGTLTLAARKKNNICLIKGSLSLNIISSISSMIALILNIADLATVQYNNACYSGRYYNYYEAQRIHQQKLNGAYAVISLLLVINLLLFCVTVSTSVFGCRSLSKVQSVIQVYMLQNDAVNAMNPGAIPVPVTTTYAQPSAPPPPHSVNLLMDWSNFN